MEKDLQSIHRRAQALSGEERQRYLDETCGDDRALRDAVEALLREDTPTSRLGSDSEKTRSLADESGPSSVPGGSEQSGQRIDRYELIRRLGVGGFGVVWLAQQHEPVKRRVALKIIKLGMDTEQVIGRFEAERQALAMMDHPNIARVFDAGATETGRPYFVMEFAEGVPFTRYCDEHRLDVPERLRLFRQVCQAVQHAHQKGIVHRDIKPSNVLVTKVDDAPCVKVIDFGIAKATESRLTEQTVFTQHGQWIGTPLYMSPEQAGRAPEDIDTRSDIYSLGVLLYESLTGTTPFDSESLRHAALGEFQRIIREDDPPRPSTRLSSIGASIDTVARNRRLDARRLGSALRGDLDWIVMKALEKDRTRRYQTASGLAEEIDRYLAGEPVQASPPSAWYRLNKFVRRNRGPVAAGLLLVAALVAGTVGTSVGLVRAKRAEGEARAAATRAQTERDKARHTAAFLSDMLAGVSAQVAQGADTTLLRGILAETAQRIGEELADNPEVEAEIRERLGTTYYDLQDFDAANEHMMRSKELRDTLEQGDGPGKANALENLGELRREQGRYDEAEALLREALEMRRRLIEGDAPEIAETLLDLGNTLVRMERYDEAERLLVEALEMYRTLPGDQNQWIGICLNSLANLKQGVRAYDEAEALYREALELHRDTVGDAHPFVSTDLHNLGLLKENMGEIPEAISLIEDALARSRRLYPDGHQETASCLVSLARLVRYDDARASESAPMLEEALDLQRKIYGEEDRRVAKTMYELGDVLQSQRRYDEAIAWFERAARRFEALWGPAHNDVAVSLQSLATSLSGAGRSDEAAGIYERSLETQKALFGETHREVATTLWHIGAMHQRAGNVEQAEAKYREAMEQYVGLGLDRGTEIASCYERLAQIARSRGDFDTAVETSRKALEIREEANGPEARDTIGAAYVLAGALVENGEFEEAEEHLKRCLSAPQEILGGYVVARIRQRYAVLLSRAERYAESVAELQRAYEGYAAAQGEESTQARAIAKEIVRILEIRHGIDPDGGHDAKAAEWRAKLGEGVKS